MALRGLYIHIPFCRHRCGYCDFATVAGREDRIAPYLNALEVELDRRKGARLETLFVGGGTPTVLAPDQIDRLLAAVRSRFGTGELVEATVEANPESAVEPVLAAYRAGGMNRVSFGLQAVQNRLLAAMERAHDWDAFIKAYATARRVGFDNINIDLIFGLPGQTSADWDETLARVIDLAPEHISVYALKIEPGTPFARSGVTVDDEFQADLYLAAAARFENAGFSHYEISNFARPGFESRHNRRYWFNEPTIGVGVSAAGYEDGVRTTNVRSLEGYLEIMERGGDPGVDRVRLPDGDRRREDLMLALRTRDGAAWAEVERFVPVPARRFLDAGLARVAAGRFSLTPGGWLVSNQLFQGLV